MKATLNEDNLYAFILKISILLTIVLAIATATLHSAKLGISILAGGSVATINFVWMRHILYRITLGASSAPVRYAQLRLVMRLGVTAVLLSMAIISDFFMITGLLVGLSSIVLTIMCLSIFLSANARG